jgi:hypothetical protein
MEIERGSTRSQSLENALLQAATDLPWDRPRGNDDDGEFNCLNFPLFLKVSF